MPDFDSEDAKGLVRGAKRSESPRDGNPGPYAAPRVTRVRVETSRMKLGIEDANTNCTIHDHDTGFNPCGFG